MKLKVKYTYETTYEYEDIDNITATNKVLEDFNRLDTRADNILPPFTTSLNIEYLTSD